jgi:raffinose/stachyose/melibiose transport system substrate-binding protein
MEGSRATMIGKFLMRYFSWLVIGAVIGWAFFDVATRQVEASKPGEVTIRIAHYQLEPGVRDGLDEAAAAYQKLHPNVRVKQEAIPEGTYAQWLSTQLMGGTAPDIVQIGQIPGNQMIAFYARYILPLTPFVSRPNPYNKGTALDGAPLIQTFKDGMRKSYINELQEFMNIPLGLASMRIYYNKDLLRKLTGTDDAPRDFQEFLSVCEEIGRHRQPDGKPYIPIAGSAYHYSNGWAINLIMPLTYQAFLDTDFNGDGLFSKEEMYLGFLSGRLSFAHPAYEKTFRMVLDVARFFPHGWSGLNRDEAIFNFAQGRAVFMSTGMWEAEGIQQQADGKFEIGKIDFLLPDANDPVYGEVVVGPRYENPEGGMPMAIANTSQHPEVALDFLLFLTSQKQNEAFNKRLKWIPIIEGAQLAPGMEIFEPRMEGVFPAMDPSIGPESLIKWEQMYSLYRIGQIGYREMAEEFSRFYLGREGRGDYAEFLRNMRRGQVQKAQFAVGLREKALEDGTASSAIKYRVSIGSLALGEANVLRLNEAFTHPEQLGAQPPFRYSPTAIEQIRKQVKSNP